MSAPDAPGAPTPGILFVISAPSGTGKSTVARRLLAREPALEFSVSYTTRPRRRGERDGRDYHFVGRERFEAMIRGGELLEWASVFGQLYGTGLEATRAALAQGRSLLLDIDVQGVRQVRSGAIPAVCVMLLPPDFATLESRLRHRGSEAEEELGRRLAQARAEAEHYRVFDYIVVNDSVEGSVSELASIVAAERNRSERRAERVRRILDTFPRAEPEAKER